MLRIQHIFLNRFIIFSVIFISYISFLIPEISGFYDEFLAMLFFSVIVIIIGTKSKIHLYREEKYIFYLLAFIAFWGLLSNYMTLPKYKTNPIAIYSDFIVIFKAYIAYFGIRLLNHSIDSELILNKLAYYVEIIFYLLVVMVFLDLIFQFYPIERRYGLRSVQLFFSHPSRFSTAFGIIFMLLLYKYINRRRWFLITILLFGMISLRVKFFGFVLIAYVIFHFRHLIRRIPRRQIFVYLGLFSLVLFFLFQDRIMMFFSFEKANTGWSRGILTYKSIVIANDFFPFGTGFGTYAGVFSGIYYSWTYELYGLDRVYGLSPDNPAFVADQFWPMVLGQFGWFGFLAYGLILYYFIMLFMKLFKQSKQTNTVNRMILPFLGIFMLLIDSSSDAIFSQDRAVNIFILISLSINLHNLKHKEINNY
jgi:hypothetical protein